MKRLLLFIFVLTSFTGKGQHAYNLIREDVMVPMRDGVQLGGILYRPAQEGKFPGIVYRTPYGVDDYDGYAEFPRKAAKQGYAVLLVDVRGRLRSEGNFEAYRTEKEDGYDVIEWMGTQSFCTGKVGTYGGSYPGIVQWLAMSQAPPHLAAAAPEMTPIGSHHFFYYGGAFSHPWIDWFMPYIFADKRKRANDPSGPWDDEPATEEWEKSDRRQWYQYRPLADLPILKKYAPEYYAWLAHPDQSPWWDFVNVEKDFRKMKNPVFLESGWYDAAYGPEGATRAFNKMKRDAATVEAREQSILVLGPWNHTSLNTRKTKFGEVEFGPNAGMDYDAELLKFFDVHLKGKAGASTLPRVSYFMMGADEWRAENEWPLSRTKQTPYYLGGNGARKKGTLTATVPERATVDSYVFDPVNPFWDKSYEKSYPYDQRENEARPDVLVYTSEPLKEDLEIAGEIVAELHVSSEAYDTDFSITLSDVFPDGRSINLHGLDAGYLRMRYRNGFDKQELMKPLEVYKIRIGQVYTANRFMKGHQIRLCITSSKAPHYDPNPNTGREIATDKNLAAVRNSVHLGSVQGSRVILPVLPR